MIARNDASLHTRDSVEWYGHRCDEDVRQFAVDGAIVEGQEVPMLLRLASRMAAQTSRDLRLQSEGCFW